MNLSLVRAIDRWVGVPACFFLSGWRGLFGLGTARQSARPKKILFIQLSEMGSPLLAYPTARYLQEKYPDCQLYWCIFEQNRQALDVLGLLPERRVRTISTSSPAAFLESFSRAVGYFRHKRIDTVLDLELFSRFSAILASGSGARRRAGFHRFHQEGLYRGGLFTHPVLYNPHQHMSKNFLALAKSLEHTGETPLVKECLDGQLPHPSFEPDKKAVESVRACLAKLCPKSAEAQHLVVFNPGAGDLIPIRAWPVEHYVELGKRLLKSTDCTIAVMGLSDASKAAAQIGWKLPSDRVANLVGHTSTREMFGLLSAADLFVTADSGPAHFSSLVGTKSIVLFGPETPALYAPLSDHARCLSAGLSCSPCLSAFNHRKTACKDPVCMRSITVDEVFRHSLDLMGARLQTAEIVETPEKEAQQDPDPGPQHRRLEDRHAAPRPVAAAKIAS